MYDQVLVPLDRSPGSERVLPFAVGLAGRLGARLALWGVAFDERLVDEVETYLRAVLVRGAGGRGEIRATWSHDPAATIAEAAADQPGTLVCMATHARGRIAEAALGSVSFGLLAAARAPVVFVGPHAEVDAGAEGLDRIIACLDGSVRAESVLGYVAELARDAALEVTVARAVGPDTTAPGPSAQDDAAAYLAGVVGRLERAGRAVEAVTLQADHPADALVGFADERPGSLLALTVAGEGGSGRTMLGRVAASVLRRTRRPVLVVPAALLRSGD